MSFLLSGTSSTRLDYRPIVQEDFDLWLPFFYHSEAIKLYPFPDDTSPEELCQQWLDRQFNRYKDGKGGFNALIEKDSGKMIGHCGLLVQEVDTISELEIGYALLPEFWGNGYAIEAARHCKNVAFDNEWSNSLISIIHPENQASIKVAEKNGLKYEKNSLFQNVTISIWRVGKS